MEINPAKSINRSSQALEFAKRTVVGGNDCSAISLQQLISSRSLGSKVSNAYLFIQKGLISTVPHLAQILTGSVKPSCFRNLKQVGLPALSLLNLLAQKEFVELRRVLEVMINPRYEDFDLEKASFDLPLHSLLRQCLNSLNLKDTEYLFSKEADRKELAQEYIPFLSATILQEALAKAKSLTDEYDRLVRKGASSLFNERKAPTTLVMAQFEGFFEDVANNLSGFDPSDLADDIEDILYRHAKTQDVSVSTALSWLDKVEAQIFKFTFKTEKSNSKFEKDSSPILKLLRKSEGSILIPY